MGGDFGYGQAAAHSVRISMITWRFSFKLSCAATPVLVLDGHSNNFLRSRSCYRTMGFDSSRWANCPAGGRVISMDSARFGSSWATKAMMLHRAATKQIPLSKICSHAHQPLTFHAKTLASPRTPSAPKPQSGLDLPDPGGAQPAEIHHIAAA